MDQTNAAQQILGKEDVYAFSELARRLPRVGGRRIHVSTIHRWCRMGVRGVRLEFRLLGGRMMTSVEAVDRFSARIAAVGEGHASVGERLKQPPLRTRRAAEIARGTDITGGGNLRWRAAQWSLGSIRSFKVRASGYPTLASSCAIIRTMSRILSSEMSASTIRRRPGELCSTPSICLSK